MVVRTNGAPRQGVWFSADVRFVQLTVTGGDFVNDLTIVTSDPRQADVVNSGLEQVIEILQTRGTVIGLSVASATVSQFIVDYGQAIDPLAGSALGNQTAQNIASELETAIDAISGFSSAALVVEEGFAQAALVTPT